MPHYKLNINMFVKKMPQVKYFTKREGAYIQTPTFNHKIHSYMSILEYYHSIILTLTSVFLFKSFSIPRGTTYTLPLI